MFKRLRRDHSPRFKAKVAIDATEGKATLAEQIKLLDVHPNRNGEWKNHLLAKATGELGTETAARTPPLGLNGLHDTIGQLALECFFAGARSWWVHGL